MEEVMSHDKGLGITGMERFEECTECQALCWGTCVGRAVLAIQASHITNA